MTVIDALRNAHHELRKAVPAKRRAAHKDEGKLAKAFREAMVLWDEMKAKGGTLTDLTASLAQVLRHAWPIGECACPRCRWQCPYCDDTGAIFEQRPARIYSGRLTTYVVPCKCPSGRRFIETPKSGADFKAAGKTNPTRVGR